MAIAGLAILTYANTLHHGFVWDDPLLLEQKVRFYRGPLDAWFEPPGLPNMRMYRPLEMMSLWIDQTLWWRNAFGFHLTQVLLHALNGALVVILLLDLGAGIWPALAASAIFVVHPAQVESVAWITCRGDVLTGTFAVLALLAFRRYQRRPTWATAVVIALVAFLGTAAKESGVVTPVLLATAALTLNGRTSTPAARLRSAAPALAAAVIGVTACMLLRPANVTTGVHVSTSGIGDALNLGGSFGYHVARIIAPIGFAPYVPKAPVDALHLALAVGALVVAAYFVARPPGRGLQRFAVLWFLLAVAPAVAVVLADFTTTPVAERRLYLGMVGIATLVASALTTHETLLRQWAGSLAVGILVATLAAITVSRNRHWHDDVTLWSAVTDRLQTDAVPYLNLGFALANQKRVAEAETAYRRGLAVQPTAATRQQLAINLGLLLMERGELDEASSLFTTANEIGQHAIAHRGLGVIAHLRAQAAQRAGDVSRAQTELVHARQALERAIAMNPRYYQAHYSLARVLYDSGQYRSALTHYQRVVELAGDTDAGQTAAGAVAQLSAWLAAHPDAS